MIKVEVIESDIRKALNNSKLQYSPLDFAASRALKTELDRTEVHLDKVIVWMYDDSDYVEYKFSDEESYVEVYDFLQEWELFCEDNGIEEFVMNPFCFNLEEKHDPRTGSRSWVASSFDYSEFDEDDAHRRKKSRNRLTDDDDWV